MWTPSSSGGRVCGWPCFLFSPYLFPAILIPRQKWGTKGTKWFLLELVLSYPGFAPSGLAWLEPTLSWPPQTLPALSPPAAHLGPRKVSPWVGLPRAFSPLNAHLWRIFTLPGYLGQNLRFQVGSLNQQSSYLVDNLSGSSLLYHQNSLTA